MSYEQLFLDNLPLIERIIGAACRRQRLRAADAEDAASAIKLRLIVDDYAIFHKFENRSKLSTYLTVVIRHLLLDYQVGRWGKWRPSAEARRRGPAAVRLEALLYRDRLPLEEAIEVLRTNLQVHESADELRAMAAAIPARVDREDALKVEARGEAFAADAELAFRRREKESQARTIGAALDRALSRLPPQDRLVFKLRYVDGLPVAEIARVLRVEAAPLYRKLAQAHERIRRDLEAERIGPEQVREVLEACD